MQDTMTSLNSRTSGQKRSLEYLLGLDYDLEMTKPLSKK